MKRKSCLTLALILIMAQVISLFAVLPATATTESKNYDLVKATDEIKIDGTAEGAWSNAGWSSQFVKVGGDYDGKSVFDVRFKAMWAPAENNQMNVYLLVVAKGLEIPSSRADGGNFIQIQIGNEEGTEYFWSGGRKLGSHILQNENSPYFTNGDSVGLDKSYQLAASGDVDSSKLVIYEFCYTMDKADSIKLDVLVSGGFYGSKWQTLQHSWAGTTQSAMESCPSGTGKILDTTELERSINIIKTEDDMTVNGEADEAAWEKAEWSEKFVQVKCDQESNSVTYLADGESSNNATTLANNVSVRFKALWQPAENGKMNVYILVVVGGVSTGTSKWTNGHHIRIQIESADGTDRFLSYQKHLTNITAANTVDYTDGGVSGDYVKNYQLGAVNDIANSGKATYEFCYQMDEVKAFNFDILQNVGMSRHLKKADDTETWSDWKYFTCSWAGMDKDTYKTSTGATGVGVIIDTTEPVGSSIDILKTTETITIDGKADEAVWNYADSSETFGHVQNESVNDFSANFKALWSPVSEDTMHLYLFVTVSGEVTSENEYSWAHNLRVQIETADGTQIFWTGMKRMWEDVAKPGANGHATKYTGASSGDANKEFYLEAQNLIASTGVVTYEFRYTMKKSDFIRLDVYTGTAKTSETGVVSCGYSWAGMTEATASTGANGFGNIVETKLADVKLIEDQETMGASVYLDTDNRDYSGIRFMGKIDAKIYNGLMAQGATITTGTLVTYTDSLEGIEPFDRTTLEANGLVEGVHFYDIVNEGNVWYKGEVGAWSTAIYDIQNFEQKFSARDYITVTLNGNTETFYETYNGDNARSIAYVAKVVYDAEIDQWPGDETGEYTAAQEDLLSYFFTRDAQEAQQ